MCKAPLLCQPGQMVEAKCCFLPQHVSCPLSSRAVKAADHHRTRASTPAMLCCLNTLLHPHVDGHVSGITCSSWVAGAIPAYNPPPANGSGSVTQSQLCPWCCPPAPWPQWLGEQQAAHMHQLLAVNHCQLARMPPSRQQQQHVAAAAAGEGKAAGQHR